MEVKRPCEKPEGGFSRRAFLLELGDRTRDLVDPEAIVAATSAAAVRSVSTAGAM